MLWKKIQHHQLIFSFVVFLFFSFLFSAGLSQDSYATSGSCILNATNLQRDVTFNLNQCSGLSSSSNFLVHIDSINFTFSSSPATVYLLTYSSSSNPDLAFASHFYSFYNSSFSNSFFNDNDIYFFSKSTTSIYYNFLIFRNNQNSSYASSASVTLSFTDEFNQPCDCPEPEEPDCPEPETPYGDKLDDIKKAIYVCGAVLIMLYFFFCIYKIIVKDGGSR